MEENPTTPISRFKNRLINSLLASIIAAFVLFIGTSDIPKFFSYALAHKKSQNAAALVALLQMPPPTPLIAVDRVVDGDTIDVAVGKSVATIRMIGINTPEVVDPRKPVQCFGPEASANAHKLMDGGEVRLELDPSQDIYDKYGRVLAYVFLSDGTLYNELAVQEGFAHEYTYQKKYKYQQEFKSAQKEAKKEGVGLWNACD